MNRSRQGLLTLATLALFGVGFTTSWIMSPQEAPEITAVAVEPTITLATSPPPTDPTAPIGTVTATTLEPGTAGTDSSTTVTDPTTTVTAPVTVAEQFLTAATNDIRNDLALPSLSIDVTLKAYAWRWAMHMAVTGTVSHSDIEALLDGWTLIGENVVAAPNATSAIDALIASPSHYEVITNAAYTDMGIGVVLDSEGTMWVAQVLAGDIATTTTVPPTSLPTLPEVTIPEVTLPTLP